jgi:E3 ubiquitin-protein ligase RNF220
LKKNPQGTGFHTRNRDQQDVEEEIDIDGDDQAAFGEAQFTERDIIPVNENVGVVDEDVDVDIEGDRVQQEQLRLRELVATSLGQSADIRRFNAEDTDSVGEADRIEMAIISARQRGDKAGLILALEVKVTELVSQNCFQFCPCWKLR